MIKECTFPDILVQEFSQKRIMKFVKKTFKQQLNTSTKQNQSLRNQNQNNSIKKIKYRLGYILVNY